jgi:hypothetical protein
MSAPALNVCYFLIITRAARRLLVRCGGGSRSEKIKQQRKTHLIQHPAI